MGLDNKNGSGEPRQTSRPIYRSGGNQLAAKLTTIPPPLQAAFLLCFPGLAHASPRPRMAGITNPCATRFMPKGQKLLRQHRHPLQKRFTLKSPKAGHSSPRVLDRERKNAEGPGHPPFLQLTSGLLRKCAAFLAQTHPFHQQTWAQ
jgi:hypothetical protein